MINRITRDALAAAASARQGRFMIAGIAGLANLSNHLASANELRGKRPPCPQAVLF